MKAIRKSSSSSSDSEDNEELNRLRAAVDPEFQKFVTKNGNGKRCPVYITYPTRFSYGNGFLKYGND